MLIVAAHAGPFALNLGWHRRPEGDYLLWGISETIAHNSTVFFALISGLLFSAVLARKGWGQFFRSKLLNVMLPYVWFTILFTYFVLVLGSGYTRFTGSAEEFLHDFIENLIHGSASFQFWYIPVLAGLFTLTPVLAWLMARSWASWPLAILLAIPLVIARTFPENSVQNVLVFAAPYTFGIWLGADYANRLEALRRWSGVMMAVVAVTSVATFWIFYVQTGPQIDHDLPKPEPIQWFETFTYLQKMALACLVLFWLQGRDSWLPRWLDLLAMHAFAIYFIHMAVIAVVIFGANDYIAEPLPIWLRPFAMVAMWVFALAVSLGISVAVQKVFGSRSRMIIGA